MHKRMVRSYLHIHKHIHKHILIHIHVHVHVHVHVHIYMYMYMYIYIYIYACTCTCTHTHTHTYHSDFSIHRQCLKDLAAGRFTGSSLVTQQKPPVGRPLREQRRQRLRLSMRQSPVSGCTARAGGHVLRGWVRDRARNFRAAMPGLRTEAGRWLKRLGCTHTHTDRQTHTQTHRHTHRHTDTHTRTHTHTHTHVCMYVCMYVYR